MAHPSASASASMEFKFTPEQQRALGVFDSGWTPMFVVGVPRSGKFTLVKEMVKRAKQRGLVVATVAGANRCITENKLQVTLMEFVNAMTADTSKKTKSKKSPAKQSSSPSSVDVLIVHKPVASMFYLDVLDRHLQFKQLSASKGESVSKGESSADNVALGGVQVVVVLDVLDGLTSACRYTFLKKYMRPENTVFLSRDFVHSLDHFKELMSMPYKTLFKGIGAEQGESASSPSSPGSTNALDLPNLPNFPNSPSVVITEDAYSDGIQEKDVLAYMDMILPKRAALHKYELKKEAAASSEATPSPTKIRRLIKVLGMHYTLYLFCGMVVKTVVDINDQFPRGTVATIVGFCSRAMGRARNPILCKNTSTVASLRDKTKAKSTPGLSNMMKNRVQMTEDGEIITVRKSHDPLEEDDLDDSLWVNDPDCVLVVPYVVNVQSAMMDIEQLPLSYVHLVMENEKDLPDGFILQQKDYQQMDSARWARMVSKCKNPLSARPQCTLAASLNKLDQELMGILMDSERIFQL